MTAEDKEQVTVARGDHLPKLFHVTPHLLRWASLKPPGLGFAIWLCSCCSVTELPTSETNGTVKRTLLQRWQSTSLLLFPVMSRAVPFLQWQHAGCSPRAHKSLLAKRSSVLTGSDTRIPDCCSCQGLPLGHTHAEPGMHRRTLARGIPQKHSWTFSICRKQIYCGVLRTGLSPYSSSAIYWMLMLFIIFQDLLCHSEAKEHASLTS